MIYKMRESERCVKAQQVQSNSVKILKEYELQMKTIDDCIKKHDYLLLLILQGINDIYNM